MLATMCSWWFNHVFFEFSEFLFLFLKPYLRLHTFRRNNHPSPVLSKPQTSMVTKSNKNLKVHGTESTKKNNRLYDFSPRNGVISLISPLDGFFMFFLQCWRVCTHSCIEDVTNFHVSKSGGHPLSKKFTPDGLFHFSLGSLYKPSFAKGDNPSVPSSEMIHGSIFIDLVDWSRENSPTAPGS